MAIGAANAIALAVINCTCIQQRRIITFPVDKIGGVDLKVPVSCSLIIISSAMMYIYIYIYVITCHLLHKSL